MTKSKIMLLEASQTQAASDVLSAAFGDDPLFQYLSSEDEFEKLRTLSCITQMTLRYAQPYDSIYVSTRTEREKHSDRATEIIEGVAVWISPEQFPLNSFRLFMSGGYALPFRLRLNKLLPFINLFLKIEARHKALLSEPHWYLSMLGIQPGDQGQGRGSALIKPALDRADAENVPCYLETSTTGAIRFYQRQGFKVVERIELVREELCIWIMIRLPNSKN